MAENKNELALNTFYPEESLKITEIIQQPKQILIKMKSITHNCICPRCNQKTDKLSQLLRVYISIFEK